MGFDLTTFFADCTTSHYCDEYFFENRYDGLAMVNDVTFTFAAKTTLPVEDTSAFFNFCIEEDA